MALRPCSVILSENEIDLLLCPPLRADWSRRGESMCVWVSGHNARRVVFGTINLWTGHRLFLTRDYFGPATSNRFCGWWDSYWGWQVILLDEDSSHTAASSARPAKLRFEFL